MASSPPTSTDGPDQDKKPLPENPNKTERQRETDEDPSDNPRPSPEKTLTLETEPDPRDPQEEDEPDAVVQQPGDSLEEGRQEEEETEATSSQVGGGSAATRRGGGPPRRKKGNQRKRIQEKRSQEKLKVLVETLRPVPFVPVKALDFSRHEKLLKTLGLWDFVHMEFDSIIRRDLVAQLIAFYNPEGRCSYVNGARINLNRADLARALKLPKKRDRLAIPDEDKEVIESDESLTFIEEFVSTWVLLQGDDTWMMPKEIVEWKKGIKEKQWEKLDWAGLFWFMVEKELKAEPPLGDCYYALHMQCLIKSQKEDLLMEETKMEEDDVKEVDVDAGEENKGGGDVKMADPIIDLKEEEKGLEEPKIELNLGQEGVPEMAAEGQNAGEEQLMEFEENKKEEQERWLWNENSNVGSHFLRPCNMGDDVGVMECDEEQKTEGNEEPEEEAIQDVEEEVEEGEEEGEKHERGFPLFTNGDSLDMVAHENLILGDASPNTFSSGLQVHGNSTVDFLASRAEFHMIPSGSSLFGDGSKREIDHENDTSHHTHTKRLRTDEPSWDDKSFDFDTCMGQIQNWIAKARVSYAEKDRACGNFNVSQQMLLGELQRRDEMIQQLEKMKFEEQQSKDLEIYRLGNELRMMERVLEGYRKALKETQKAFKEHREQCPMHYEPVYKDVKDSGGLVLSAAEVEKQSLKQEEEDRVGRIVLERKLKEIESGWIEKFEGHNHEVGLLSGRLLDIENKVKLLKESFAQSKSKISETTECSAPADT